jgi:phosphoglycolate phosphatase
MATSSSWQAVLLDLDGTLLDTLPDLAAAANNMRVALDMPSLDQALIGTFVGKGVDSLVMRTLAGSLDDTDVPADLFAHARAVFFEQYHAINGQKAVVYAGVVQGLEALRHMGLLLGVVTNKPTEFTLPLLERTDLAKWMSVVVCGDTCERRKPDPQPIHHACEQLNCVPNRVLTIGDSINDALAGKAAGCSVLAVPYGYNEGMPVTDLPVDGIVTSVFEAPQWLQNNAPRQ